ncbi:Beta-1,3-galactosyl-O-glycosyl-glycoprotein beta-1,6-N-acetylglucosaminyltransferase 4 [Clonorchis sinensis]|uniref:Beta-1,3-galactosyl-O-glycosyl-glycoprotein beta-1,6-N-acetylglucosaminyltransferase 4 n=1 Tax=Clonorchis sinensis TaxID=79923 RepID=A0A419PUV6_CLOSI|nr:Beta-1,3-galactosyl-O-glycosyl-glycoprotein beta-1,6-N-acetylglucosaminyltransferase 4 [Clonorchis sinensis]
MSLVSFNVEKSTSEAIVMRKFKLLAVIIVFLCVVAFTHWIHNGRQSSTESSKPAQPQPLNLLENTVDCGPLTQLVPDTWLWTTEEEQDFPLAFAISAYESFERLARLLRLIYRKHNIYCIHVDRKAIPEFRKRVKHLAKCYGSNLITIPDELSVDVNWGYFTVLQTTLLCAEHLLKQQSVDWQYMLNLNEKEFPLRTNWELVRALKNLNGSNIVEGMNGTRFQDRIPKKTLSFKFEWVKGSLLVALRRDFVAFMFTNPKAVEILNALKAEKHLKKVQDELFFSTLAYNPKLGAPGACLSIPPPGNDSEPQFQFLARYANWNDTNCPSGLAVRGVCILGWKDISVLIKQPHLFANKFLPDFHPEAYAYMEQLYVNKVSLEHQFGQLDPGFDERIFANLYCSQNHI